MSSRGFPVIKTGRFVEKADKYLHVLQQYRRNKRDRRFVLKEFSSKPNLPIPKKKKTVYLRCTVRKQLMDELDELRSDEDKFRKLCKRVHRFEVQNGLRKKTVEKREKLLYFIQRNIDLIPKRKREKKTKKCVGKRKKKQLLEKVRITRLKIASTMMQENRNKVAVKERKIRSSLGLRCEIRNYKYMSLRAKKWEFLLVLLSRFQVMGKALERYRNVRRNQLRRERLRKICYGCLVPFLKSVRKKKAKKKWRVLQKFWEFGYKYIRVLKRLRSLKIIKNFAKKIERASNFQLLYKKFAAKVLMVQRMIRTHLKYRKARMMLYLLQYQVIERKMVGDPMAKTTSDESKDKDVVPQSEARFGYAGYDFVHKTMLNEFKKQMREYRNKMFEFHELDLLMRRQGTYIENDEPNPHGLLPDSIIEGVIQKSMKSFQKKNSSENGNLKSVFKREVEVQKRINAAKKFFPPTVFERYNSEM